MRGAGIAGEGCALVEAAAAVTTKTRFHRNVCIVASLGDGLERSAALPVCRIDLYLTSTFAVLALRTAQKKKRRRRPPAQQRPTEHGSTKHGPTTAAAAKRQQPQQKKNKQQQQAPKQTQPQAHPKTNTTPSKKK